MKSGPVAAEAVRTIQEQHVQVDIEVQSRAEALDQGDCAAAGAGGHGQAGLANHERRDGTLHHGQYCGQCLGLGCEEEAQGKRKGQHPLPDRHFGKDVIDQVRG